MNNHFRRTTCRLCGSNDLTSVLKLASTPPANSFVDSNNKNIEQETFPLELFFCEHCAHLQLTDIVDPRLLFENYVYVSGTSPNFINHFKDYAQSIIQLYSKPNVDSLVIDIGSNDGTLLKFFKESGFRILGIDPAISIAENATKNGIETLPSFFTSSLSRDICKDRGFASVITANNVFAHADNLQEIIHGVKNLLAQDGIFVFEVSYLVDVFEKTLFDTIYHEHLSYHSVIPLKNFFSNNGMELINVQRVTTHGGSIRGVAQLASGTRQVDKSVEQLIQLEKSIGLNKSLTLKKLADRISSVKYDLNTCLEKIKQEGKSIAGYGAPAKTTTLMYEFGIDSDQIDFIVDDSPLKQGLFTPGLHIPVLPTLEIYKRKPDYLLLLAWNFANPIMEKHNRFLIDGGHFILPLPTVQVI